MLYTGYYLISLKKTAKNSEVDAHDICVLSFTSVGQGTILRTSECTIIERLRSTFTANGKRQIQVEDFLKQKISR